MPLKHCANNIKGTFHTTEDLLGKRIAIIYDVRSRASLNELAKSLKKPVQAM